MKNIMLFGCTVMLLASAPAFAQQGDESGLAKKYRISIGSYGVGSVNSFDNAILSSSGKSNGVSFKFDLVTHRPTRHETLLSYQYFNDVVGVGSASLIQGEYRWRFDKFGRAYYGINLGYWKLHTSGSETLFASGSAIGYHFNKDTFLELRYVQLETDANVSTLMIGKRF